MYGYSHGPPTIHPLTSCENMVVECEELRKEKGPSPLLLTLWSTWSLPEARILHALSLQGKTKWKQKYSILVHEEARKLASYIRLQIERKGMILARNKNACKGPSVGPKYVSWFGAGIPSWKLKLFYNQWNPWGFSKNNAKLPSSHPWASHGKRYCHR